MYHMRENLVFNMNKTLRYIIGVSALVSAFIIMLLPTMNFKTYQIAIMVLPITAIVFLLFYATAKIYISIKKIRVTNN